jgi:hypothetical protein
MRLFLATALLLLLGTLASAEEAPVGVGRHFIVAFPDTLRHWPLIVGAPSEARFVLFAQQRTTVQVTGPGFSQVVTIDSSASTTVRVPSDIPIYLDRINTPLQNTFEIVADADIVVYAYFINDYGSEGFTPLPVEQWGTEYFVASARSSTVWDINYRGSEENPTARFAPAQFAVIASRNDTRVDITGRWIASVVLDSGEAYLVESPSLGQELIGTRVVASAPIAVIAGATRTAGPGGGNSSGRGASTNTYQNSVIDWLAPTSLHGTMFMYVPVLRVNSDAPGELIRIVATAPGATTVRTSLGRTSTIQQGDTIEIETATNTRRRTLGPIIVMTDQPAEMVVVTGHYVQGIAAPGSYTETRTWATAMVEATPRERWMDFSRFHAPTLAPALEHWLVVVADSAARVWVDGREMTMQGLKTNLKSLRYGRVQVTPGDHQVRSAGGRFGAILHGTQRGYEAYRPPLAKGDDGGLATRGDVEESRDQPLHPSTYLEDPAFTYALPLVGLPVVDSLSFSAVETCDSLVIEVDHRTGPWAGQSLIYRRDPAPVNAVVQSILRATGTVVTGFRFRFMPVDRTKPASMTIQVVSASGLSWPITYRYEPELLEVVPTPVSIVDATVGIATTIDAWIVNRGAGDVQISGVRLLDGMQGFTIATTAPTMIEPGDSLPVTVTFTGVDELTAYRDSIIVETECGRFGGELRATTRAIPRDPVPMIDSLDWRERWLSTLNQCTKSGISSYDSALTVTNLGNIPYVVAAFTLEGADADAGIFEFDHTDRTTSILAGDTIAPISLGGALRTQRVRFRPRDERPYSAIARLVTNDGQTVFGELRGIGIESHIALAPDTADAGTIGYSGGIAAARCTITVRSLPTRPLLVRELRIIGDDAAEFDFDESGGILVPRESDPSTWWQLAPGEEREVPMLFVPSDTGRAYAQVEALGDHSRCDDSTNVVTGMAIPPIGVGEVRPIARSACGDTVVAVSLVNRSGAAVTITRADATPVDEFEIAPPLLLPLTLAPGDTLAIPIRYHPTRIGVSRARIDIDVRDESGARLLQNVRVSFAAEAIGDTLTAHIVAPARMAIGETSIVRVLVDQPQFALEPGAMKITAGWNPLVLRLTAAYLDDALADEWTLTVDRMTVDSLEATMTPKGDGVIASAGTLLKLAFLPFLGPDTLSEIHATITTSARPCVESTVTPGIAHLDSICGLANRLFELFDDAAAKLSAAPNPFDASTTIAFALPVPGHARIDVIDAYGRVVATLVDADLDAGGHVRTWTPDVAPTGMYHLRMTSGELVRTAPLWRVR